MRFGLKGEAAVIIKTNLELGTETWNSWLELPGGIYLVDVDGLQ